ncbi:sensor histidine kinase [Nonomuraea sp. MCN248]|uniref:histidine kinase n=1 Tax=Nonomuraea corallina TaxID=2989783 RepID=A0ABT4SLF7_9ACTN|nr:sensor histidine kinase [Nonomuraea corallina]MDA0637706.1 sensor histidine kinase [Nonomuraea corallina]
MFGKVRAWSARRGKVMDALWVAPVAVLCLLPSAPRAFDEPAGLTGYVVLTLLLLAPLMVWWRRPVPAFCGVALVSFGQWAAGVEVVPANLAVLVALWAVAARCSFRWSSAAVLVTELGVFLALVRWDTPTLGMFTTGSILVVTIWLAGLYASTRRRYLEGLEERARRAELERDQRARMAAAAERARIARELHDVVAHHVSVMVVQADGAGYAIGSDAEQARLAVRAVSRTGREALAEMRRLVGVLREDEGAGGPDYTPQPGLAQLEDLVRGAGVPARLRVTGDPGALPEGVQLAVYRIVQEALTNTLRHGGPRVGALVELRCRDSELVVRVTDDGLGAAAPPASGGHGLLGMRERAAMYGGEVTAGPRPGGGFEVLARLPVPRVRAA